MKFMDKMIYECDEGGKEKAGCNGRCIENQVICLHLTIREAQQGEN